MSKWHLRDETAKNGTVCHRRGDYVVGANDFRGLIASSRCNACERAIEQRRWAAFEAANIAQSVAAERRGELSDDRCRSCVLIAVYK
jgi:hypothetical protein